MAPGLNLLRPRHRCVGVHGSLFGDDGQCLERRPIAALMADGPSRSGVVGGKEEDEEEEMIGKDEAEAASTIGCSHHGWLRLGIGGAASRSPASTGGSAPQHDASTSREKGGLVELDLFGAARRAAAVDDDDLVRSTAEPPFSLRVAGLQTLVPPWLPAVTGGFPRPTPSSRTPPLQLQLPLPLPPVASSCSSWGWLPLASLSSSSARLDGVGEPMRVVNLPRRTQTGVWFVLQAAQDQIKEPFLPQIPKSYLRIKDGRMTIRLLMKYLAKKLVLEDESQVEISCRGQQLPPFMTLMYVRDNIWVSPEEAAAAGGGGGDRHTVSSADSMAWSSKYIMSLLYSRSI